MQILNLIHPRKSEVGYKVIKFPDGQLHLKLESQLDHKEDLLVIARITSADELFILMQALDVANRHGMRVAVKISYLMGARMDRVMSFNEPFTLKIILDVLEGFDNFYTSVLEPHNPNILRDHGIICCPSGIPGYILRDAIICYPDKGAFERSHENRIIGNYIFCHKRRDTADGELSDFILNSMGIDLTGKKIVVLDDLCDGGRTFCGIAPLLREKNPSAIDLCVTHAIQKEGLRRVAEAYDHVYITNSYKDWEKEELPSNVVVNTIDWI